MMQRFGFALLAGALAFTAGAAFGAPIPTDFTSRDLGSIGANGQLVSVDTSMGNRHSNAFGLPPTVGAIGALGEVYSNITTTGGSGAAVGGSSFAGATRTTRLVGDDLTLDPATPIGVDFSQITFSVVNFNSVALTVTPIVTIYTTNTTSGNPTTIKAQYTFAPSLFGAGTATAISFNPNVVPGTLKTSADMVSDWFWASVTFQGPDTALGAGPFTSARAANMGELLYNPPTVGFSDDVFFRTTAGNAGTASPVGSFFFFGGPPSNPIANFYWEFRIPAGGAVPEPVGLSICGLALLGLTARRRRA